MPKKNNPENLDDYELINRVNLYETIAFRMKRCAEYGKMVDEIKKIVNKLYKLRDRCVSAIKKRKKFKTFEETKEYIITQLNQQNEKWDKEWKAIYRPGAVFKRDKTKIVYETIRTYLPTIECVEPEEIIMARIPGTTTYRFFDDREIPNLAKLDKSPVYTGKNPLELGLIKADEELGKRKQRIKYISKDKWNKFDDSENCVFYHSGFEDIFEVLKKFNLPDSKKSLENEILLSKSHNHPVFVEFTIKDLVNMQPKDIKRKYRTGKIYTL